MEIRVAEYVEFKGTRGTCLPRRVSPLFGIDASLMHPPMGSVAYIMTKREELVSSDGNITLGKILETSEPFILPGTGESYFRMLLGPDYDKSSFARRKNN